MRFVISDRVSSKGQESGFLFTKSYVEIEIPISDDSAQVVYVLPRTENSGYVSTCWGGWLFDFLIPDRETISLDRIAPDCVLARLVRNGHKRTLDEGGMLHLLDPDDSERKWCVSYLVGSIDFADGESVLGKEVLHAVKLVADKSDELWSELASNEGDVWGLGCTGLDVAQIDRRLLELDEIQEHAESTLKKLDRPDGAMERAWWLATWFSKTRRAWWSSAAKALREVRDERIRLRVARLKRTLSE